MEPGMEGPGAPPGGPGMRPGARGGGGGQAQAAPPEPAGQTGPPIEPNRANPFARPGVAGDEEAFEDIDVQEIGPDWSSVPITERSGFLAPEIPDREAAEPPPEGLEFEQPFRVTSIMWTAEGQAMAVYEHGSGRDAESGVVRPGGRLSVENKSLLIERVRQDHVVVKNRETGDTKTIYLSKKAPEPEEPERSQRDGARRERWRPRPQ